MVPPAVRVGLPTQLVKSTKSLRHSEMILDSVKLTIYINHQESTLISLPLSYAEIPFLSLNLPFVFRGSWLSHNNKMHLAQLQKTTIVFNSCNNCSNFHLAIKFSLIYLLFVYECFICMYVYAAHMCSVCEGIGFPETGVTGTC